MDANVVLTASEQKYRIHDYVFVQPHEDLSGAQSKVVMKESDAREFWVAKILEIRAKDEDHAYARVIANDHSIMLELTPLQVYWMYWPDDLPMLRDCSVTATGRRNYHGKYELIASNHMEILNVCTFAGLASVSLWQETDDDEALTGLYLRQTYDYCTGKLSVSLPKICFICNPNSQYHNRPSRSTASVSATTIPIKS
jgi:hypothetical protein